MQRITQTYPGRSAEEIFGRVKKGLWDRRREISHHEIIDKILTAVKWDDRMLRAGGSKRVMLVKSGADIRVTGETVTLELTIPFRDFEKKYCERIQKILETLFD